jgi:hypothetical protein
MFNKFAAAAIAAVLIAGPVLAQGTNNAAAPATAPVTAKATAPVTTGQAVAKPAAVLPTDKAKEAGKVHVRKVHTVKKHIKRVKMTKHRHHIHVVKHIKRPAKTNFFG